MITNFNYFCFLKYFLALVDKNMSAKLQKLFDLHLTHALVGRFFSSSSLDSRTLMVRMSATLAPCAIVIWESVDDKDLEEFFRGVVSNKYFVNYGGNVLGQLYIV